MTVSECVCVCVCTKDIWWQQCRIVAADPVTARTYKWKHTLALRDTKACTVVMEMARIKGGTGWRREFIMFSAIFRLVELQVFLAGVRLASMSERTDPEHVAEVTFQHTWMCKDVSTHQTILSIKIKSIKSAIKASDAKKRISSTKTHGSVFFPLKKWDNTVFLLLHVSQDTFASSQLKVVLGFGSSEKDQRLLEDLSNVKIKNIRFNKSI